MEWISIYDKNQKPIIGELYVAWMSIRKEPVCVRYKEDNFGPLWIELVTVDISMDREDIISHYLPLPQPPPPPPSE